ncbi:MAG: chemotaxis protein CheW [Reinekea sp.]
MNTSTDPLLPPSEALALLNQHAIQQKADNETDKAVLSRAFFGVRFDSFGLLFDDSMDKELIELSHLRTIPNSPSWLDGFSNVRGTITPVLNLHRLFGLERNEKDKLTKSYLLALNKGDTAFALPVTAFPEKLSFLDADQHHDEDLAPRRLKPYVESCFRGAIPWFLIRHCDFLKHLKNCP